MKNVWVFFFSVIFLTSCANERLSNSQSNEILGETYDESENNGVLHNLHGSKLWSKVYSESRGGDIRSLTGDIRSLTLTPDDGALLGGNTWSSGAGKTDMYLVRVNGDGNKLWEKTYGGSSWDYLNSLVLTSDGGALLGGKTSSSGAGGSDMYLVRVDEDGTKRWEKTYGGPYSDSIYSLALTPDGGALLGGLTYSSGTDISDMYLVRVNGDGNKLWEKTYGGSENDSIYSLAVTPDGGALLGGLTYSSGAGGSDMFLVRVDEEGNKLWEKTYGGPNLDAINSLVLTPDGGALLGGHSSASELLIDFDMSLVRVDEAGNKLWEKTYGGSNLDVTNDLVLMPDGGALLGGKTNLNDDGKPDMSLVRVDGDGNKLWEKTYGESQNNWISSLVLTHDGGALLGGAIRRDTGQFDMYLVRIE